jgi:hypothetical protein
MSGNIKYDKWINDDNTENYKCRAWVNFIGSGTVAIRASGGVSAITDNGVGLYTISFTTDMQDANYCLAGVAGSGPATLGNVGQPVTATPPLVGSVQVNIAFANGSLFDPPTVNVAIFR